MTSFLIHPERLILMKKIRCFVYKNAIFDTGMAFIRVSSAGWWPASSSLQSDLYLGIQDQCSESWQDWQLGSFISHSCPHGRAWLWRNLVVLHQWWRLAIPGVCHTIGLRCEFTCLANSLLQNTFYEKRGKVEKSYTADVFLIPDIWCSTQIKDVIT